MAIEERSARAAEADDRSIREGLASAGAEARSLGSAVGDIAAELRELVAREQRLAAAEMSDSVSAVKRGAMYGGIGAVLALLVIGFLALSAMYGLDTVMPQWLAALATAGIVAVLAAIVALLAKRALGDFTVVPKRTVESVKEDVRWASEQIKRNGTSSSSAS